MITLAKIKEWIVEEQFFNLKYIRTQNEYRFATLDEGHQSLVQDGDTVISAGQVGYAGWPESLRVGGHSMKLMIGTAKDDLENIKKLFGLDNPH